MNRVRLCDQVPSHEQFLRDVCQGLQQPNKSLPAKYFYDQRGAQLFEQICRLPEYYLTRTELAIMQEHAAEMAACMGSGCVLVEFGSGSGLKTELLLDRVDHPAAYVPVDISRNILESTAARLAQQYPELIVRPVCADFTIPFTLSELELDSNKTVGYFPGSTIGNFSPDDEIEFLHWVAELCGRGGGLLIGADLKKDRQTLARAYDDESGVTKQFNLNLLARINRELGADFQLDRFEHHAFYNEPEGRIEMHLISSDDQAVRIGDNVIEFTNGESIHTENSYKYDLSHFRDIAHETAFDVERMWTDERQFFSVQYLTVR